MKIGEVIAALERIRTEHGDLNCAEEQPLGFVAIRYVETRVVPELRAVRRGGITDGETVVLIRAT